MKYIVYVCTLLASLSMVNTTLAQQPDTLRPLILRAATPEMLERVYQLEQEQTEDYVRDVFTEEEIALLEEGDIIMRRGNGGISEYIAELLQEPYHVSHCGMILTEGYDEPHVIHTLPDHEPNIHIVPVSEFIDGSVENSLIVSRPMGTPRQKTRAIKEAKNFMAKNVPFDIYFSNEPSRFYCSEYMFHVFLLAYGYDILPTRRSILKYEIITMDNFINPDHFEVIINHHDNKESYEEE